ETPPPRRRTTDSFLVRSRVGVRVPARRALLGECARALAEVGVAPVQAQQAPRLLERAGITLLEAAPDRLLRERHRLRRVAEQLLGDRERGGQRVGGRGDQLVDE